MRLFELPNKTRSWRTLIDLDSVVAVSVTENKSTVSVQEPDKKWDVTLHTVTGIFTATVDSHEAVESIIQLVRDRPVSITVESLIAIGESLKEIQWVLEQDYRTAHGKNLPERPTS